MFLKKIRSFYNSVSLRIQFDVLSLINQRVKIMTIDSPAFLDFTLDRRSKK